MVVMETVVVETVVMEVMEEMVVITILNREKTHVVMTMMMGKLMTKKMKKMTILSK